MAHYCTFFDHRYAARGLLMIRSLRRFEPDAGIWVLCLDDVVYDFFLHNPEPGVRPISQTEFDTADPELAAARGDGRTLIEYYFSLKATLLGLVLNANPAAKRVTYLDSDLWFFASHAAIFAEAPEASVLLIPHRFRRGQEVLQHYGLYNAGWLSFRFTPDSLACLAWWRARCLEWCHDRVEDGRYADQRYLDDFARLFMGVHAVRQKGANLAPWNVGGHRLERHCDTLLVDGSDPLIFFHVHGLKPLGPNLFLSPAESFQSGPDHVLQREIYRPYLRALRNVEAGLPFRPSRQDAPLRPVPAGGRWRFLPPGLKKRLRLGLAALRGHLIWLP